MEKAGMVLTASPTLNPSPPGPTAATVPAASYPMRAGKAGCSMYSPRRNIDSARLSPSALTLIWTSPFPGGGTSSCSIFRTAGPPVSWNRITRAIAFSCCVYGSNGRNGRLNLTAPLPPSFVYIDVNTLDLDTHGRLDYSWRARRSERLELSRIAPLMLQLSVQYGVYKRTKQKRTARMFGRLVGRGGGACDKTCVFRRKVISWGGLFGCPPYRRGS